MATAVIFGGRSCEHDVSVITGVQTLAETEKLDPVPVYIDRSGNWFSGRIRSADDVKNTRGLRKVYMCPGSNRLHTRMGRTAAVIDTAILCCHGANGEDGTLQGFLELCGVAYTGSDVYASALCMDKARFKRFATAEGFTIVPYTDFTRAEFNTDIYSVAEKLNAVGYPFMIKPSRQGSSIGIGKAANEKELVSRVRTALAYDDTVIAEKLLSGFREFNCAAISDGKTLTVSEVEEPVGWKDFLSYEDKYAGKKAVRRRFPARIDDALRDRIRAETERIYRAAGLGGVIRADFMLGEDGTLYLNEVNTLPGSLASYFFAGRGMTADGFYEKLIADARLRKAARGRLVYKYRPPSGRGLKNGK